METWISWDLELPVRAEYEASRSSWERGEIYIRMFTKVEDTQTAGVDNEITTVEIQISNPIQFILQQCLLFSRQ